MVYFPRKNDNTFRANFNKSHGTSIDDISHLFGYANHSRFYTEMDGGWATFIDSIIPDYFPFGTVQSLLLTIVKAIYNACAEDSYDNGVSMGLQIVGKVNEAITWAQNQINSAVTDMRNRIDTEIVDPVRQKAAQIEQNLKDAQTKLNDMGITIDGFQTNIDTMKSNISSFGTSIESFNNKLTSFDSKLKGLDSTASKLQSQLDDAKAKLTQYKTLIDQLTSRVDKLEGKKTEGFNLLKNLGV